MAATEYMNGPNILGVYSIQHIVDEFCKPILVTNKENNAVFSPKYMYIRKLIPVVLDLYNVQYTCWSTYFRDAARANNLLHHIDPTIPTRSTIPDSPFIISTSIDDDDDTILWCQKDAVLLTWIYATISPYLLIRLVPKKSTSTSAMDAWARLRDICQQHDITVHKKKRRFIHIDLNEDYDHQGGVEEDDCVDLISALPDDVLIYMLSLATDLKTAGRTSLLSKRWTNLWTHLMDLDFNDNETSATLTYQWLAQPEMDKFVDWVNRVISANQAPYLHTLRIHFPLNTCYAAQIDNWVKFAFDKEVRNLELDFIASGSRILFNPALILNTTLESLHLKSVSIKGPLLQWVITNCLNLQRLSLHRCTMASADDAASSRHHLKLVISSPKLKHLEFFHCLMLLKIDTLHLSAPNLTTFIYCEFKIDVEYRSVPSLVDVTFGTQFLHHVDTLSGVSSQLEKLSILWDEAYCASSRFPINSGFPTFINIQQLEIVYSKPDVHLVSVTSLIEACPLMHTFKLKLMCREQLEWPRQNLAPTNAQSKAIPSHQHLKAVEYLGYAGCASAAELALCLTRHAPMLRRFIFDTRQPQFIGKPRQVYTSDYRDQMEIVRKTELLAKQIRSQVLAHVVIL